MNQHEITTVYNGDMAQDMSYMLLIEKDGIKSLPITRDTLILGPDEVSPLEAAGGMMMAL